MKSISQLNTRGTSSLNYTDDRNAAIIFDRPTASNQSLTTAVGQAHTQQPGILILDIIKPDSLNIYYEIDVGSVAGATVTWASLPSGVTLNSLGSGKYRITNIDTVAQWDGIKNPTVNIPSGWEDNFVYTAGIYYDPSKSKTWTNSVVVTVRAQLTSNLTLTGSITGIQKSFVNINAVSTISRINGGFKKPAAAALTANASIVFRGTYAVGKLRSVMTTVSSVTARLKYAPGVLKSNMSTAITMIANPVAFKGLIETFTSTFTQTTINTDYFTVESIVDDTTNTNVFFGTSLDFEDIDATNQVIIAKGSGYNFAYIFNKSGSTWTQEAKISTTSNAIGIDEGSTSSGGPAYATIGGAGSVKLYSRSSSTWTLSQTFTPPTTNSTYGAFINHLSREGDSGKEQTVIVGSTNGKVYVLSRRDRFQANNYIWYNAELGDVGAVWTDNTSVSGTFNGQHLAWLDNYSGSYLTPKIFQIGSDWSQDGSRSGTTYWPEDVDGVPATLYYPGNKQGVTTAMAYGYNKFWLVAGLYQNNTSSSAAGYVKIYHKDEAITAYATPGGKEIQTLQANTPATNDLFGKSIDITAGGDYLVVGAPGINGGEVYVYKKNTNTNFVLDTILRPENPVAGMRFGETVKLSSTGSIVIGAPNIDSTLGTVYVYTRVAT